MGHRGSDGAHQRPASAECAVRATSAEGTALTGAPGGWDCTCSAPAAVAGVAVEGVAGERVHKKSPAGPRGPAACQVRCGEASCAVRHMGSSLFSSPGGVLPRAAYIVQDIAQLGSMIRAKILSGTDI